MANSYYSPIPNVGMEITNRCNLHCQHCFNHSGENQIQELSLSDLINVFDQIEEMGGSAIRISGGEPTLHPDFAAIIMAAKQRQLHVSLNSHGVYSQDTCQQLIDLSIEQIIISLDGLQDANDRIRGNGVFQRVLKTIATLRAAGQSVTIGVHLGRYNRNDIPGLVALAADLGCDIKFSPLRPLGRAKQYLLQEVLQPLDFYHAVQDITRLRAKHPGIRIITDYDILRPFETVEPQPSERANCPAGRSFLNIGCDGFLYPCAFLITPEREFAAGHIHEISLLSAWQQSPVFKIFRELKKDENCQACPVYTRTCVGGCMAISYLNTGDMSTHDPTCFIAHATENDFIQREQYNDLL